MTEAANFLNENLMLVAIVVSFLTGAVVTWAATPSAPKEQPWPSIYPPPRDEPIVPPLAPAVAPKAPAAEESAAELRRQRDTLQSALIDIARKSCRCKR